MSSHRQHEAEELDAAVMATDERMTQLWLDLRGLAEAASTSTRAVPEVATSAWSDLVVVAEGRTHNLESSGARVGSLEPDRGSTRGIEEHGNERESDLRTSAYWEELFGGGGGSGGSSDCDNFEGPLQRREAPVIQSGGGAVIIPSPWQINCFGGGDTEVGTRVHAVSAGSAAVIAAPFDRTASHEKRLPAATTTSAGGRHPPPQPHATTTTTTTMTSDSRSVDVGAVGRSDMKVPSTSKTSSAVLRHAIDDIIGGRSLHNGVQGRRVALRDGESLAVMLERERRVTLELREGVARLRAEKHQKAVDEVNAQRSLENLKRREEEDERRSKAGFVRQLPPTPVSQVIFHRAVQTVGEFRSESTQTAEMDDVYIDASLLDHHPDVRGRGRQSRKKSTQRHAPPWGGGGGRKHHNRVEMKPDEESASLLQRSSAMKGTASPLLPPGRFEEVRRHHGTSRYESSTTNLESSVAAAGNLPPLASQLLRVDGHVSSSGEMSRFEERCALALSRHLGTLDARQRQSVMDDWGAADGGFEGADLCIRIEVTAVEGGVSAQGLKPLGLGECNYDPQQQFIPVQPQPLRQLRFCLGSPASSSVGVGIVQGYVSLGWIKIDYDDHGHCQLPALCACVVYREKRWSEVDGVDACRHFLHFSFRRLEHRRIFRRACLQST